MNNDNRMHLIPPSVIDIVEKFNSPNVHVNEKMNYLVRLEAIRDYCIASINKNNNTQRNNNVFKENRSKNNYSRIGRNNV
jgi:hypothetical protein